MSECIFGLSEDRLTDEISSTLMKLGVPVRLKGFGYLCYAIYLTIMSGSSNPIPLVDKLYVDVEKKFSAKPRTAERNMRTAIEAAFLCADVNEIFGMFGKCRCQRARSRTANLSAPWR